MPWMCHTFDYCVVLIKKMECEIGDSCITQMFFSNSVAVEPGNQLLSPERKNTSKPLSEGEIDSNVQSK